MGCDVTHAYVHHVDVWMGADPVQNDEASVTCTTPVLVSNTTTSVQLPGGTHGFCSVAWSNCHGRLSIDASPAATSLLVSIASLSAFTLLWGLCLI